MPQSLPEPSAESPADPVRVSVGSGMLPAEVEATFQSLDRIVQGNEKLDEAIRAYREVGSFTPQQAVTVFGVMKAYHLHKPSPLLKISLRTARYKKQLEKMSLKNVKMIWPLLSAPQRRVARSLGRSPDNYKPDPAD